MDNDNASFLVKLNEVINFYNLTNSEICTITKISRKTLNEIIYENKDPSGIYQDKLNILFDLIKDNDIKTTTPLNQVYIQPLLSYLDEKEINKEEVKKIVLDIIKRSEEDNILTSPLNLSQNKGNTIKRSSKDKNIKKTKRFLSREQQESNLESFLFFMKMLSSFPIVQ